MAASLGESVSFSCAASIGSCPLSFSGWTAGASSGVGGADSAGTSGADSVLTDALVLVSGGVDADAAVSRLGPFSQLQSNTTVNVIISTDGMRHRGCFGRFNMMRSSRVS